MSVKIATTADIHYRPKRAAEVFASLAALERESRERRVDLISISGDIFNASVFNTASTQFPEFIEAIRRLADVAPVVMVYGTPSHDIAGCLQVFESLQSAYGITILMPGKRYDLLESGRVAEVTGSGYAPERLMIFGIPEPAKGWLLAGQPAMGKEESDAAMKTGMQKLLLGLAAQRKQHPDIPCLVLYHGQIRGATMDNGQVVENAIGRDDLAMIGADYYALGDIHAPQQIGDLPMYYPGSVYPTTWGETHQCGFNVVTIHGNPTDDGDYEVVDDLKVERVDYPHPQQMKIETAWGSNKLMPPDIGGKRVWQEITATKEQAATVDTEALTESLRNWGAVEGSKVTVKITATETVRAGEITKAARLRDKVVIFAENSSQEIAESVLDKADELEEGAAEAGHTDGAHIRLRKLILRGAIGIWKGQGLDEIEVDLDEYDPGLIGLLWPNGAGKTTLIENMHPWPELLTRGSKLAAHFRLRDSFRDLTFVDERTGDEYRALLQINGTSKAGEIDYLLYRNGEPVTNGRKEPYLAAIDSLFGGLSLYLRSAFVSQKDAGLADATKGERKALLVELSGLEYLQGYAESAKGRARIITDEIATDNGWITATEEQLAALPDLNAALDEKQQAIRGGEEAVRKHEEAGKAVRAKHDAMAAKVEADRALRQQREELNTRDGKLTEEIVELTTEREGWEAAAAGREEAAERVANWEELEGERKKLEASKAEKLAARTEALEAYNTARATYDGQRREMETAERAAEATLAALRRDRAEADGSKERLGELLDKPRHDTCPECGAALPWAADELTQREKWRTQMNAAQSAMFEIDKHIPDAEEAVEAEAAKLRALTEPTEPKAQHIPEDDELERIAADQEYLDIAASRAVVEKAAEAAVHVEELLKRFADITDERTEIEQQQGELFVRIDDTLADAFTQLTDELEAARLEHSEARETLAALTAEAEALTAQIADLERKAAGLEERKTAVAGKRRDADEWTWLQKACGADGIQALELDALAPSIEEVANRLLQAAYGSRFSIRFETTRMDATGKKQIEDFLILIADSEHGDEQELATLSGGEAVWIKRALYDAFGIIRARNTGLRFLTVCQDESDGALDPERREQYARMLEAAHVCSGRHHTIMITHSAEVQEMLSQRIEVSERAVVEQATDEKVSA